MPICPVPAPLKDLFRSTGEPGASGNAPSIDDWTTWLSGGGHCIAIDASDASDDVACTAITGTDLDNSTACLTVMKEDGTTPACNYYAAGQTTPTTEGGDGGDGGDGDGGDGGDGGGDGGDGGDGGGSNPVNFKQIILLKIPDFLHLYTIVILLLLLIVIKLYALVKKY